MCPHELQGKDWQPESAPKGQVAESEVFKLGKVYWDVTALNHSLPRLPGKSWAWDATDWRYEAGALLGFGSVPRGWVSRFRGCLPTLLHASRKTVYSIV